MNRVFRFSTKRLLTMRKTVAIAALALLAGLPALVWADAPPGPYFNGFETDTAGWFNYSGATITRVPSGSNSTYANGDTAAVFPPGGYSTGADIYLDVPYAQSHLDTRFDWDSAINDTTGNFRRDFVFNVGTDALGFVMTGGNNSTRCGANPADPGHAPVVHISISGWYTFKHT